MLAQEPLDQALQADHHPSRLLQALPVSQTEPYPQTRTQTRTPQGAGATQKGPLTQALACPQGLAAAVTCALPPTACALPATTCALPAAPLPPALPVPAAALPPAVPPSSQGLAAAALPSCDRNQPGVPAD